MNETSTTPPLTLDETIELATHLAQKGHVGTAAQVLGLAVPGLIAAAITGSGEAL